MKSLIGLVFLVCATGAIAQTHHKPRQTSTGSKKGHETRAVSYRNCTEARNAGAAPIRRGQPGYAPKLDRDNDGVACE